MSKVTEKNTKAQILEAYEQAIQTIAELKAGKTTTAEVVKAKEIKAVKEDAQQVVDMNILDSNIITKYNNLLETIKMLEAEIEELYGIKKEADTLEALINAYKDKQRELENKYNERINTIDNELEIRRKANKDVLNKEVEENTKEVTKLKQAFKEQKEKLEKERAREREEYTYNLNRERSIENDKWADEKAEREKELSVREKAAENKIQEAEEVLAETEELRELVVDLKKEIEESYKNGLEEGKKKAATSHAIEVNHLKKEHEWALSKARGENESLSQQLHSEKMSHADTKHKLDEAYAQITNTAMAVANAGVKVTMDTNK